MPAVIGELATATVTAAHPILVRGDTTLYDVTHYAQTRDLTPEDVLGLLPGVRVLPNGTVQVDGRAVEKVLLEGRDVSNACDALLTRGPSAGDIASVEVRRNETDPELRGSLLAGGEFVVMDIELKPDVARGGFGQATASLGHEGATGLAPGGQANLFRLGPRVSAQVFAESDRFGEHKLWLEGIDGIGQEAYAAQFDIPADFGALAAQAGYCDDLYGFRDYVTTEHHLDGDEFLRRDLTPALLTTHRNRIFGRFARAQLRYEF